MSKNYRKLLFIITTIILYSIIKLNLFDEKFDWIGVLANCLILLALTIIITLIWSVFRLKKWGFIEVFYRSHIVALALIIISLISGYSENLIEKSKTTEKTERYKKIVSDENPNPVKKVGDIDKEFLNQDNLYENYIYNYAVRFPENYKINYGLGEYSNVLAYNEESGRQINITTGDNNLEYSLSNDEANKILESITEEHIDMFKNGIVEKWKKEGSFQQIKLQEKKVVNFYNKKFVKLSFKTIRNLNDTNYSYVVTDYITFFKNNNYHFYFEGPEPQNSLEQKEWEDLILKTMIGVRISNEITQ